MVPFSSYIPLSISRPSVAIRGTNAVNSGSSYVFTFFLNGEYSKKNSIRITFPDVQFIFYELNKGLYVESASVQCLRTYWSGTNREKLTQ